MDSLPQSTRSGKDGPKWYRLRRMSKAFLREHNLVGFQNSFNKKVEIDLGFEPWVVGRGGQTIEVGLGNVAFGDTWVLEGLEACKAMVPRLKDLELSKDATVDELISAYYEVVENEKWDKKVKTAIKQSADIDMSTKDRIGVNLAKKLANGQREARKAEAASEETKAVRPTPKKTQTRSTNEDEESEGRSVSDEEGSARKGAQKKKMKQIEQTSKITKKTKLEESEGSSDEEGTAQIKEKQARKGQKTPPKKSKQSKAEEEIESEEEELFTARKSGKKVIEVETTDESGSSSDDEEGEEEETHQAKKQRTKSKGKK